MNPMSRIIEQEYSQLCSITPTTQKSDIVAQHPTACLVQNYRTKNRYGNVLPVESTRVKLDRDGSDIYINANHVSSKFICTQAPLTTTFDDFWMMVWDKDCPLICALNRLMEGNAVKGDRYWPEQPGESMLCGEINVTLLSTFSLGAFDITIRYIKLERGESQRTIFQLHYLGWPDFGVPSQSLAIRELVNLLQIYRSNAGLLGPSVVHCSAGIGRTGTFLAIAMVKENEQFNNRINSPEYRNLLQGLISQNAMQKLDEELYHLLAPHKIHEIVLSLRQQRNHGTVQNLSQYVFIYSALKDEALNPCPLYVTWKNVFGWHLRENISENQKETMLGRKKRKRTKEADKRVFKKPRGLAQAPMSNWLEGRRTMVECPTNREDVN